MAAYDRAVIVGVGLLGGSIGMALQQRGLAREVVGVGRSPERLAEACRLGAIGRGVTDLAEAAEGADLVVICTPVRLIAQTARECLPLVRPGGLVTDVGSTKESICNDVERTGLASRFCGSHPLAGSEKQGAVHADAELFRERVAIVTPLDSTEREVIRKTEQFWQSLGSRTVRMSPGEHDQALAWTSHMPHVVAAALAATTPEHLFELVASGWMDTTRVAAGGIDLWSQILMDNRRAVVTAMREFNTSLTDWIEALESKDAARLEALLAAGKIKRDSVGSRHPTGGRSTGSGSSPTDRRSS